MNTINAVWLEEPRAEGAVGDGARVGFEGVTRIERREDNMGTYGIAWFDVFKGDVLFKSFNALCVAAIHYEAQP